LPTTVVDDALMPASEYQSNFSELYPQAAADVEGRRRKAQTVRAVLTHYHGGRKHLETLTLLDVGAGNGVIDHCLAEDVGHVLGMDIDRAAIEQARRLPPRPNLRFEVGDGMAIDAADASFDIVLCAHVYEHVPDAERLMREIRRVLRPAGICYMAAGNRYQLMEPHYRLPILSVMPKSMAHTYLRLLGRGHHYYEQHLSYWGLRRLVRGFRLHDYTRLLIEQPEHFHVGYLLKPGSATQRIAQGVARFAYGFVPTYIWVLEKER
jgi:2-polyprenyl-3-methyl-5-hydroxy-6-metoxy-1,4-benzoquinol methylase